MPDLDYTDPDLFTTGTVGPPGQRVFYLQVVEGLRVSTFRVEKQQVAALADSLAELLIDLPEPVERSDPPPLQEPLVAEWVVGAMGLGYDGDEDRIMLAVQEIDEEADAVGADDPLADDSGSPLDGPGDGPATARVLLTCDQAVAFVHHARQLVDAGRPPCPFCGRPLDPAGHACPRMN